MTRVTFSGTSTQEHPRDRELRRLGEPTLAELEQVAHAEIPAPAQDAPQSEWDDYQQRWYEKGWAREKMLDEYRMRGLDENGTRERQRLHNMSLSDLKNEWKTAVAPQIEKETNDRQTKAALTFMANEPRYIATPENAKMIWDEIERLHMDGTVTDIMYVFDNLVAEGKMEAKFIPPTVPNLDKFRQLGLDEMREQLDTMGMRS